MPPQNGRQPRHICGVDGDAIGAQFFDCGLHVDGIPVGDSVQRESQRAELLFLPLSQRIANLSPVTVIDFSGKLVAEFLAIQLYENSASEICIIDVVQNVQSFDQAPEVHERLGQCGGAVSAKVFRIGSSMDGCLGRKKAQSIRGSDPPVTPVSRNRKFCMGRYDFRQQTHKIHPPGLPDLFFEKAQSRRNSGSISSDCNAFKGKIRQIRHAGGVPIQYGSP